VFSAIKKTVKKIVQEMDIVIMEYVIAIQFLAEIIARLENASTNVPIKEFVKKENVFVIRYYIIKVRVFLVMIAHRNLFKMEKSMNTMKFNVIKAGLEIYVIIRFVKQIVDNMEDASTELVCVLKGLWDPSVMK
jgi:hypothetical protein